jgi:WbqC-like protein family
MPQNAEARSLTSGQGSTGQTSNGAVLPNRKTWSFSLHAEGEQAPHPGCPPPRKSIAVMQPYFFPYAGYFRLFASVDEFVIFDCVQFPRRGRVHRTEVPGPSGKIEWLTLPLAVQPRHVLIDRLTFATGARASFDQRLKRLTWVESAKGPAAEQVRAFLHAPLSSVIDYLENSVRLVAELLRLNIPIVRSSALKISPLVRGQDRVIAIAKALSAARYVNAPGGRALYDPQFFQLAGIELSFLTPYRGPYVHLLQSLMMEQPDDIRADVIANCQLEHA